MNLQRRILYGLCVAVALLEFSGCGAKTEPAQKESRPVALSGTVQYDDKPVPKGRIEFTPDPRYGGKGSSVSIEILDGKYAAPAEQGPMSGGQKITITGFDGVATPDKPDGKPLFPKYETTLDLSPDQKIFFFTVPKANKK